MDDQEERDTALKACHQRCADRTLKVLEKNGSIFIKLGQHLVGNCATLKFDSDNNDLIERDELPLASRMDDNFYPLAR